MRDAAVVLTRDAPRARVGEPCDRRNLSHARGAAHEGAAARGQLRLVLSRAARYLARLASLAESLSQCVRARRSGGPAQSVAEHPVDPRARARICEATRAVRARRGRPDLARALGHTRRTADRYL